MGGLLFSYAEQEVLIFGLTRLQSANQSIEDE